MGSISLQVHLTAIASITITVVKPENKGQTGKRFDLQHLKGMQQVKTITKATQQQQVYQQFIPTRYCRCPRPVLHSRKQRLHW
jgi:hypothetical protein